MITRQHVRQFLALVDSGSFSRAAGIVGVTQPTLSAGIAELERQIGAPLFVRERRQVRLTEAGNRLLGPARAIDREFRLAEASAAAPLEGKPQLRLGILASTSTRWLDGIVRRAGAGMPLTLVEGADSDLRMKVSTGKLDAALTLLPEGAEGALLLDEGYAMMLPATHRLAERARLDPEELAGETMIARRGCEILQETSRFFTRRGVRPPFALRSANDDRCMAMVAAGLGITTAPLSLLREGVVAVSLEGYDFRRRIGLILARDLSEESGAALLAVCRAALES